MARSRPHTDITVLPEVWGSNNTGELKALIELFDYLVYYANLPPRSDITIYTDSEYAMRLILGDSLPNTHHQLVTLAQQYYTALRTLHHVTLSKVAGRSGVIGNELADSLAKKGVTEYGSLGRFSGPRTAALSPPDIGYNTDLWLSLSPDEQNLRLLDMIRKHIPLIPTLPVSAKKPWISPSTLEYITSFQAHTDLTIAEVKQYRNKIKKLARKDKKQVIMTHLQEDFHGSAIQQWRTARTLRKDFRPTPTNLINTKGKLVSKAARAETFADYLANQAWKAPDDDLNLFLRRWKKFQPPLGHLQWKSLILFCGLWVNVRLQGRTQFLPSSCKTLLSCFVFISLTTIIIASSRARLPLHGYTPRWLCLLKTIKKIQSSFRSTYLPY